jgi:trehalose synthase
MSSILTEYEKLLGKERITALRLKAENLVNKKVLHVNSTKYGGGVAEILQKMVPLMKELGLKVEWKVFSAPDSFFEISKKMHNTLQGNMELGFSDSEISQFLSQAKSTYEQIRPDADFNIIHDPQPCPMIDSAKPKKGKWIWRCHIDTSNPNPQAWNLISNYINLYDAMIFTKMEFAPKSLHDKVFQITPSIDPFSEKNKFLSKDQAKTIVEKFVHLDKPLITQVSRFDPWKDPLGVIDTYRLIKEKHPVQLALIGSLAHDDPEGKVWLERINEYKKEDPDIHILSNLDGIGALEVNSFQRMSAIILQKSIKEGFGLTVTEGLWKEIPVIGGNVGGIKLQIDNGINGFLVDSTQQAAEKALYILKNPKIAKEMGKSGRKKVQKEFLLDTHVEKYLDMFLQILKQ